MNHCAIDIIFDIRATVENLVHPWRAFVGLVELRTSKYCDECNAYAINPQIPELPDLGPYVLLHPDAVDAASIAISELIEKEVSHEELAAWLYWAITERNKEKRA